MTLERWPDAYTAVSQQQCEQMLADGATGLMIGCWGGGYAGKGTGGLYDTMQANAQNSLRNMRQAGGRTAIYSNSGPRWVYSWGTIGPKNWWEETQRAAGSELAHISFAELDFEIADNGLYIQSDDMLEFIADLRTLKVPVIGYSGDWFCGLMHAAGQRYDYSDVLDGYNPADYARGPVLNSRTWPMHPRIVGVQYSGGSDVHGVNCDLNMIDGSFYAATGGAFMALSDIEQKELLDDTRLIKAAIGIGGPDYTDSLPGWINRVLGRTDMATGQITLHPEGLIDALAKLTAGGIDYAALAKAVNDDAAKRMAG